MHNTTHAATHASADPQVLADTVFARLVAATTLPPGDERIDILVFWEEEIRCRLQDRELAGNSARARFEASVVARLAGGWQPGSDALFCAATLVFGWKRERQRLASFGQAGAFVSQAIDQRSMFENQREPQLSLHRKVLARLRNPEPPADHQVERYMLHLEMLAQRFPQLLAICIDPATVARWRSKCAGLYAACPDAPGLAAEAVSPKPATPPAQRGYARLLHLMFRA